jgi:hypothetical protein
VRRRLDAWSVLLVGVLITLGVIILLATPGPWHRVVPEVPHVRIAPPPPADVAVFVVTGRRRPALQAALVVHIDYELPHVTVVLVPREVACRLPGAGLQPLSSIVTGAGPAAGAAGLGTALGIPVDGWVQVDPASLRKAFPAFMAQTDSIQATRVRLEAMNDPWVRHADPMADLARQLGFLRVAASGWRPKALNVVAFGNYLLGATDVRTDLKLQGVSTLGAMMDRARPRDVTLGTLPVRVVTRGAYRLWVPEPHAALALSSAFAAGAGSPAMPPTATRQTAARTVVMLTQPLGPRATQVARALDSRLRRYGGACRVRMVACSTTAQAVRAVAARPARPPLAVVVAFGRTASASGTPARVEALDEAAIAAAQTRSVPVIVSVPPLPDGPRTATLAAGIEAAAAGADLAVSRADRLVPSRPALSVAAAHAWGAVTADLLARAVQPAFFAPALASTRLGFTFAGRRATVVAVVDANADRGERMRARLENDGWGTTALTASSLTTLPVAAVFYRTGSLTAALSLAADLGLPRSQVEAAAGAPRPLTLVMPVAAQ